VAFSFSLSRSPSEHYLVNKNIPRTHVCET
jgi:hypothetical protein